MRQIADFHIHSRYSRACSPQLELENIDKTCRIKGVDIVATGDFTYPQWFSDIENKLEEIENSGLYKIKEKFKVETPELKKINHNAKFILSTELALIYTAGGKCRRIHIMVMAPNLKVVRDLNKYLDKKYNIRSDGRPILGMSAVELAKICFSINPKFLIFPAHIWTPWFAVFGSKSGFDSMEECFGKYTKNIFAYETGLSSDPEMNARLSMLDKLTVLSDSDAHSLRNIGREANVFDLEKITYNEIYDLIKNNDKKKIKYTIEFYPEEGMYHLDGHRDCNISFTPAETKKYKGICPVCKKPLTIGVSNRVDELADRPEGFKLKNAVGFKKLIELDKIIAETLNIKSRSSKKVQEEYMRMIKNFGTELDILINIPIDKIKKSANSLIAEGIEKARKGDLIIKPGFDGHYGEIKIFNNKKKNKQSQLL